MYNFATIDQLKTLNRNRQRIVRADEKTVKANFHGKDDVTILGLPGGYHVVPSHLFDNHNARNRPHNGYGGGWGNQYYSGNWWTEHRTIIDASPFLFVVTEKERYGGDNKSKMSANPGSKILAATINNVALVRVEGDTNKDPMSYGYHRYGYYDNTDWCYSTDYNDYRYARFNVVLSAEADGNRVCILTETKIAERLFGLRFTEDMEFEINGIKCPLTDWNRILNECGWIEDHYSYGKKSNRTKGFDYTLESMNSLTNALPMDRQNAETFLKAIVKKGWIAQAPPGMSGVAKTWKKLTPFLDEMMKEDPVAFCALRSFASKTGISVESVKLSVVFNEMLGNIQSKDELIKTMRDFWLNADLDNKDTIYYYGRYSLESAVKDSAVWKEKRKAVLKSQGNRAFGKLMQEMEFLNLDEESYPVTTSAIKDNKVPLGTFFRKSEQYFLLNDNFDLWEEMLKRHEKEAVALANEVKGRTTYEKDLMSYFYFVLYTLPEYLEKHTGKKWTCKPKMVNSANELEPPKEGDNGITRQRSALTPIVDNENCTVEVPYASLAIGGSYGTTYCYSHDYHVLSRGFSFNGNTVMKDIEEKLNGKDDYGLMFYTLTGSAQGRGYPTFLIIFERRNQKGDTKVHFHRTHPSRSKQGDYNPIHNWTKVCYNWMAGNINKKLIKAQQGDLFFVDCSETATKLEFNHQVNSYDKHTFDEAVAFAEYDKAAKSNILGYVKLERDTMLSHTEHDDVMIPAGMYAIHQCRSWEANPKGVWSLRID